MRPEDLGPPPSPSILNTDSFEHPDLLIWEDTESESSEDSEEEEVEMVAETIIDNLGIEGAFLTGYRMPPARMSRAYWPFKVTLRRLFARQVYRNELERQALINRLRIPSDPRDVDLSQFTETWKMIEQDNCWKDFEFLYSVLIKAKTPPEFEELEAQMRGHRRVCVPFRTEKLKSGNWPSSDMSLPRGEERHTRRYK